jgi:hypothetical protein
MQGVNAPTFLPSCFPCWWQYRGSVTLSDVLEYECSARDAAYGRRRAINRGGKKSVGAHMSLSQFDAGAAVAALQLSQMLLRLIVKHGLLTTQQAEDELLRLVKTNRNGPSNAIVVSMLGQLANAYSAARNGVQHSRDPVSHNGQRRRRQPRRDAKTVRRGGYGRLH